MISAVTDRLVSTPSRAAIKGQKTSESGTSKKHRGSLIPLVPLSRHRIATYRHWERFSQGHRLLADVGQGQHGLMKAQRLLVSLLRVISAQLAGKGDQAAIIGQLHQELTQLPSAHVDTVGLDHRFHFVTRGKAPSPRTFVLRAVDLLSHRANDEMVELRVMGTGTQTMLPANARPQQLRQVIASAVPALGLALSDNEDTLEFIASDGLWRQMAGRLELRGQGQRLPAGELRQVGLVETYHWQDPRCWVLTDPNSMHQAVPRIKAVLALVIKQQKELHRVQSLWLDELVGDPVGDGLATVQPELDQLQALMQRPSFSHRLMALLAQANLSRTQSQALLAS